MRTLAILLQKNEERRKQGKDLFMPLPKEAKFAAK